MLRLLLDSILDAIVCGDNDPERLPDLANSRIKTPCTKLAAALRVRASRTIAEQYSWAAIARRYDAFFERVMQEHGRPD